MNLEIGPGKKRLKGEWVTMGPEASGTVDVLGIWGKYPLPFADESFDIIYASHVIEHVWWYQVDSALAEVYRCLRKGGVFEVWTVDFANVVYGYVNKKCADRYRRNNPNEDYMKWVNGKLFAYEPPIYLAHHSCYDEPYLKKLLRKVGFNELFKLERPRGEDHESNLGIGAKK